MRILIAEDETLIRLDLRTLLESHGHEVCAEARDGVEAVELARSTAPDLALVDVKMPRLDGIDAVRQITAARPIPVVMLTAYADPELVARAIGAGAAGYLTKPFREQDLIPAIRVAEARHAVAPKRRRKPQAGPPQRRREILAAAARLFEERGYDATSIEHVAEAVGILKGSLYHYISSKDDLLFDLAADARDAALADLLIARESGGDALARIRVLAELRVQRATAHPYEARLAGDLRSLPAERRQAILAGFEEFEEGVRELVRSGQREGTVRAEVDPAEGAQVVLALAGATDSAADFAVAALAA